MAQAEVPDWRHDHKAAKHFESELRAMDIRVRASRRAGELIAEGQKRGEIETPGGNRKSLSSVVTMIPGAKKPKTLAELGITRDQSSQWKELAGIAVYSSGMDPNSCPLCGGRLFANRVCRCGWPKKRAREPGMRMVAATPAVGKTCNRLACGRPARVGQLCWRHYRQLRKEVPADRNKGLACYKGRSRQLIQQIAGIKKAGEQGRKERLLQSRELLFGKAGGHMMNLPRGQRQFVNGISHESYERYLFHCGLRGVPPLSFRAHRRRWYGAQKTNWRRFDVPRMMFEKLAVATGEVASRP